MHPEWDANLHPPCDTRKMIVLFIGVIVGKHATEGLADRLSELCARYNVDLIIANAENCAPKRARYGHQTGTADLRCRC